jgi:Holliday junction resolvase-like predicted endonuclease
MMSNSRSKGKRGERKAGELLVDNDYNVLANTGDGVECEDFIVQCPSSNIYSVEVKNRKVIDITAFKKQASTNAKKKKLLWLIMAKIEGSSSWLIWRQNERPIVWHEKK